MKRLAKREAIERADKEIATLEEKRIANNQALADLEKTEFVMLDFQKAKDNELMKRINGMFQLVSFSFVNEQLNGGEKLTCVCTIDGVPYPDLNTRYLRVCRTGYYQCHVQGERHIRTYLH